jgi:AcrR family transcriptional regulator
MNKESQSRKGRRPYDNTLRQEQAEQTRQRILDTAMRVLPAAGADGMTLAELARAAGVSEPTLYRHFGTRERLYEEIEARSQVLIGMPAVPRTLAELPRHAGRVFERFGAHASLLRALLRTGVGQAVHAHGRAKRTSRMRELLAESAPHLDARSVERLAGVLRALVSWESYERLTDELGMSTEDASEAVEWALEKLIGGIAEDGAVVEGRRRNAVQASGSREAQ